MSANLAIKLFRINPNRYFKYLYLNTLKIIFLKQIEVFRIYNVFKMENFFRFGAYKSEIYRIDYFNALL